MTRHPHREYLWRRDDGHEVPLGRLERVESWPTATGHQTMLIFETVPGVHPLVIHDDRRVVEVKRSLFGGKK